MTFGGVDVTTKLFVAAALWNLAEPAWVPRLPKTEGEI
jgi:hypothetical protein